MTTVSKRPSEFVTFLRSPGFRTNAGIVALDTYMGIHKADCRGPVLFDALSAAGIKDTDTGLTAYDASCRGMKQPYEEWKIMRKGQGFYECYVRLWNWLWDNQEQLRDSSNPTLKGIYFAHFFAADAARNLALIHGDALLRHFSTNPIQAMMHYKYFGNECIGFVSNYLRWVGEWDQYKGIANGQWKNEFETAVNNLEDIKELNILEWVNNTHVAIIDRVKNTVNQNGTKVTTIDMCQCSEGGPRFDMNITLTAAEMIGNERVYNLSGAVPVQGRVFVRRKRSLVFLTS